MKKKILYITQGISGSSPIIRKDWLVAYNQSEFNQDWIINFSELNEEKIVEINSKFAAVFIRETQFSNIKSEILELIKVPVFSQLEFPYLYLQKLNKNRIYLTDCSYLHYFPKGEIQFDFIKDTKNNFISAQKEFDILFIGTFGLRNMPSDNAIIDRAIKGKWMDFFLNDFRSTEDIFKTLSRKKIRFRLFKIFKSKKVLKQTEWFLQHHLRTLRRDFILKNLVLLANSGIKVAFVTNEKAKDILDKSTLNKFSMFYDLDFYSELPELVAKTKTVVVSTPMHQSLINERFFLALENGAVPLIEPYPQYSLFLDDESKVVEFDYSVKSISNIVLPLIKNNLKLESIYRSILESVSSDLNKDFFNKKMEEMILKYSKN